MEWLWFPYIPFGKLTIIQGNPGEGKTYFAMRLAAACTNLQDWMDNVTSGDYQKYYDNMYSNR